MILILCNTFQEAQQDFELFKEYLYHSAIEDIRNIYDAALCIETDDDLMYLFIDHRYYNRLRKLRADTIDELKFMEEIYEFFDKQTIMSKEDI